MISIEPEYFKFLIPIYYIIVMISVSLYFIILFNIINNQPARSPPVYYCHCSAFQPSFFSLVWCYTGEEFGIFNVFQPHGSS